MYQNIYLKRNKGNVEVHLWDDQAGYSKFNYKHYAYKKSGSGIYRSIYGDKLKKVNFWTAEDLQSGKMFESDVPLETRILVDKYGESDDVSVGHREMIIDIEVEIKGGFPDPREARNKITAIAIYDKVADQYTCFILGNVKNYQKDNTFVESFRTEEELLQRFYQKYMEIQPTIITGWNIDGFDIPYIYNRTVRVMGHQIANVLSPIGVVYYNENKKKFKIAGVSCMDYLPLYKLYNYTQKSSYRLDAIGTDEVNMGKIEYDGTLDDLYRDDINKFIEYNLNDVVIVKALDDKLKFMELARTVSHVGHVPYEDVFFSSRYLEGAILVYMKKLGVVAPNKDFNARQKMNSEEKFSGAWVKDPIPGRHDWVYDLDLTSMYPSIIMTLNISPEMKIGRLEGWNAQEFAKGVEKSYTFHKRDRKETDVLNSDQLRKIMDNNKIAISSNGVMYRNDKKGLIPSILNKWFDERVEYKKLMKKYGDEGNKEQYEYFGKRQLVQKIILNSLYGVLGLPVFRFYDVDNAEATTTTGVELIKFTEKMGNYYYNKELGEDKDYCIYTDTDSVFYPALPLVKSRYPEADVEDEEFMTEKILEVADGVQGFLNQTYDKFAKIFLNCDEHRFDIKQELIARSAFWVTKKRYGQWIINDSGVKCDKLDVKGLDIVRSSFPPAYRKLMTEVLQGILSNRDKDELDDMICTFKKSMKTLPLDDISLPTGVKNLGKFADKRRVGGVYGKKGVFTPMHKGTPVHVKAAWVYNDLLKHYGLENVEKIKNSEKIKWVYLKQNPLSIAQIAFKGYDDPQEIMDYINQYVDHDKLFKKGLQKKIDMFYDSMEWTLIDKENTLERFF
jgi:DNA polymerase elongation subunit (family B)